MTQRPDWLEPGCFSQPLNDERTEWSDGVDAYPVRGRRGITKLVTERCPEATQLERFRGWFTLSQTVGKRQDGANRRRWLGGVIHDPLFNRNGEAYKPILQAIEQKAPEILGYLATGDQLIAEGVLAEKDFQARNWTPASCLFLLDRAGMSPDDRAIWWKAETIQPEVHEDAPAEPELPF